MENEIIVKGTQNFMGIEIPIVEGGFGENKKCILVNTVAEIHSARIDKINEMISNNIDEFETGVDIIDLMANDDSLNLAKKYKLITNNRQRHCYVLSKNGYLKYYNLIRNKNEKIYNIIINNYFDDNHNNIISFVQNKEIKFRNQLAAIFDKFKIRYAFQYQVLKYRIDIYLLDYNIAIEYDENNHKYYTYEKQELREENIKEKLNCKFIMVTDEYSIDEAIAIVLSELFIIKG